MTPTDMPEKSGATPAPAPSSPEAAPPIPAAALPWYRRPLFWSVLLLILLALFSAWAIRLEWQAHQARQAELARKLEQQRGVNAAMEAEAARLRDALKGDPCAARDALRIPGAPPEQPLRLPSSSGTPAPHAAGTAPIPSPTPEIRNVAELLEQATVLILSRSAAGVQMGTGFFIAPGVIVTNRHVVGAADAQAIVVNKATQGVLQARVMALSTDPGRDYAVLAVSPAPTVAPLLLTPDVRRTERVSAWGFPGAVTGDDPKFQALLSGNAQSVPEVVYTDGVVSVILERTPPLIVHTATVSQGNSGGPLVNDKGQVVGINTYIRLDDESYRQSSLALVASDLMAFLKAQDIPFTSAGTRKTDRSNGKATPDAVRKE